MNHQEEVGPTMRYRWLLLDADGTLFDYDQAERKALAGALSQIGFDLQQPHLERYRQINGQLWRAFEQGLVTPARLSVQRFEELFAALGIEADAEAFSRRYLQQLATVTDLIEGAEELVRSLHGRVGLAIITNGLASVQRPRLARSDLAGYLNPIIISEEIGASKPDPAIFAAAFRRMGNPDKAEVLIVGDSLSSDMRGGVDYGIDTCWFNPQGRPRPADLAIRYEIRRLNELLPIIGASEGNQGQAEA